MIPTGAVHVKVSWPLPTVTRMLVGGFSRTAVPEPTTQAPTTLPFFRPHPHPGDAGGYCSYKLRGPSVRCRALRGAYRDPAFHKRTCQGVQCRRAVRDLALRRRGEVDVVTSHRPRRCVPGQVQAIRAGCDGQVCPARPGYSVRRPAQWRTGTARPSSSAKAQRKRKRRARGRPVGASGRGSRLPRDATRTAGQAKSLKETNAGRAGRLPMSGSSLRN